MGETIFPFWYHDAKGVFDFALVEYTIGGSNGFGGVLVGGDGVDLAWFSSQFKDGRGKNVPGGYSFVGEMENLMDGLVSVMVDETHDGLCQVAGKGWCAFLVANHVDAFMCLGEGEHRLYEVLSRG